MQWILNIPTLYSFFWVYVRPEVFETTHLVQQNKQGWEGLLRKNIKNIFITLLKILKIFFKIMEFCKGWEKGNFRYEYKICC